MYLTASTVHVTFCLFIIILYDRVGPLIHHWTMRFEAKHRYFKKLATTMGNYINIPYSLAVRHQCLQAYLSEGECLLDNVVDNGKGTLMTCTCTG